jgi:hypothetical protein
MCIKNHSTDFFSQALNWDRRSRMKWFLLIDVIAFAAASGLYVVSFFEQHYT